MPKFLLANSSADTLRPPAYFLSKQLAWLFIHIIFYSLTLSIFQTPKVIVHNVWNVSTHIFTHISNVSKALFTPPSLGATNKGLVWCRRSKRHLMQLKWSIHDGKRCMGLTMTIYGADILLDNCYPLKVLQLFRTLSNKVWT